MAVLPTPPWQQVHRRWQQLQLPGPPRGTRIDDERGLLGVAALRVSRT
jgi:hypothetical protein